MLPTLIKAEICRFVKLPVQYLLFKAGVLVKICVVAVSRVV